MAQSDRDMNRITEAFSQLHALLPSTTPCRIRSMPPAVEDAFLMHLAMGLEATRRAQATADSPVYRYHLDHAWKELMAAIAISQEWAEPS